MFNQIHGKLVSQVKENIKFIILKEVIGLQNIPMVKNGEMVISHQLELQMLPLQLVMMKIMLEQEIY